MQAEYASWREPVMASEALDALQVLETVSHSDTYVRYKAQAAVMLKVFTHGAQDGWEVL